jgi:hypothetical protein
VLMRRPHEMVVVKTTRSPGWAGFGDAVIDQELIPTLPVSTSVVVVALAVVVVARAVVVVSRAVVVVARAVVVVGRAVVVETFAPTRSTDGHPVLGAGMMSSSCSA